MTDLEATRLCAEAMGISVQEYDHGGFYHYGGQGEYGLEDYDPFSNDTQCMALVKRFKLTVGEMDDGKTRYARPMRGGEGVYMEAELNYPIVYFVAKMQAAKK